MNKQKDKHEHLRIKKSAPYSERKIDSLEDLALLIQAMDQDEGIRIRGDIKRFKGGGFIFVTKPDDRYCMNIVDRIYDPIENSDTVGENDEWIYFHNFEKVWDKLKNLIRYPLEAYAY